MDIALSLEDVSQHFGNLKVLYRVDLKVVQGQFVGLVGPSGCGKSTLINAIEGSTPAKSGTVVVDGKSVTGPNRDVGKVYQHYSLYEHLTAEENVAFGLKLDQTDIRHRILMPWKWLPLKKKHLEEAREFLIKLQLGHALSHYPKELSGGMRQRVAIAQAMIMRPKLLLLDEPFGAADESIREELQEMLLRLYHENLVALDQGQKPPWTVIIITHELREAFYVCDRIVGLSKNWVDYEANTNGKEAGATKVWDKCAPVFHPDDPRDYDQFEEQRSLLKSVVIDLEQPPVDPKEHVSFWEDLEKGVGTGVVMSLMGV